MKSNFTKACVILFCICAGAMEAQNWLWAKSQVGKGFGHRICRDANNNVYLSGTFFSFTSVFGASTVTASGNSNEVLVKYDANGNVLWARTNTGGTSSEALCVCTDPGGNVLLSGYFYGTAVFGTYTLTSLGTSDVFLVKYDSNGSVLWAVSGGGTGGDICNAVCTDQNGNIFITGTTDSPSATFGTYTASNSTTTATSDMFLVKYNSNGNTLWFRKSISAANESGYGVSADANGNVFVGGTFSPNTVSFGNNVIIGVGLLNAFLVKYDASGNDLWAKNPTGAGDQSGYAVGTDAAGSVYFSGKFQGASMSSGTVTLVNSVTTPPFSYDMFIIKYDAFGNALWGKNALSAGDEKAENIAVYSSGVFVEGTIISSNSMIIGNYTVSLPPPGNSGGCFLGNYDANGNELSAFYLNGVNSGFGGLCADDLCNAWISSSFLTPLVFGSTTLAPTNAGTSTIFLAKFEKGMNLTITGNTSLCKGQNSLLQAQGASGYTWSTGSNGPYIVISPTATTMYTVAGQPGSCATQSVASIIVAVNVTPTVTILSSDSLICIGNNAVLTASGATTYSWSTGSNGPNIPVSPITNTTYSLVAANDNCTSTAAFTQSVVMCLGIVRSLADNASVEIYPNPTTGLLNIKLSDLITKKIQADFINLIGETIRQFSFSGADFSIDLDQLSPGIYFMKLTDENGMKHISRIVRE